MKNNVHNEMHNTPWLGLASYMEQNSDSFFGRSAEIQELFFKIYDNIATIVYGTSGTGKTSLLRAGIFPKLREKQFLPIYLRLTHDRNSLPYKEQIFSAIRQELQENCCSIKEISPLPANAEETLWSYLHRYEITDVLEETVRPVLVFDQFEEFFTISEKSDNELKNIITEICDIAGDFLPASLEKVLNDNNETLPFPSDGKYRIVLSLRDDFIARVDEISHLCPPLRQNRVPVKAMNTVNAMEVVYNRNTGDIVSEEVAGKIIAAVSENMLHLQNRQENTVEPALLSLFCQQINQYRLNRSMPCITEELVQENKDNILTRFYENAMNTVSERSSERLEDNMISDSGFRLLKAVDDLVMLGISVEEINKLIDLRILRTDTRNGVRYIELCHDILLPVLQRKRAARRMRKRLRYYRKVSIAGLFVIIAGLVFSFAGYFLFSREYTRHYKDFVKKYGIPHGLSPLSKNELANVVTAYRFHTKGLFDFELKEDFLEEFNWKDWQSYIPFEKAAPYRVAIVDCRDNISEYPDISWALHVWSVDDSAVESGLADPEIAEEFKTAVIIDFIYDSEGRIKAEIGKNKEEKMVWGFCKIEMFDPAGEIIKINDRKSLSSFAHSNITAQNNSAEPDSGQQNTSTPPVDSKVNVTVPEVDALFTFIDKHGYPLRRRVGDDIVLAYVGINYSEEGYDREIIYLDPACQTGSYYTKGRDDAGKHEYIYYADGRIQSMLSLEYNRETLSWDKINDACGNHELFQEYDDNGRLTAAFFNDTNGNPVDVGGYASLRYEYDDLGRITETTWQDVTGNAGFNNGIYKVEVTSFHANNREQRRILYSLAGHGVWGDENLIQVQQELDDQGNQLAEYYCGADGKPTANSSGISILKWEYNADGHMIKEFYYDIDGNPTVDSNNISHWENTAFYEDGTVKEDILYSIPGYGVWGNENVMQVKRQYNEHGSQTAEFYYGIDGDPTVDSNNVSHWENIAFHEDGSIKEGIFYSLPGYGVWGNENVMQLKWQYNEQGFPAAIFYYDIDGNPTVDSNNISHCEVTAFYEDGTLKENIFYSLPGYGIYGYENVMQVKRQYNEHSFQTAEFYYDIDGNPTVDDDNISHCEVTAFYEDGTAKESIFYSLPGYGFLGDENIMKVVRKFNGEGEVIAEEYYDKDGNAIDFPDDSGSENDGTPEVKKEYDSQGRQIAEYYYDKDGNPTADANGISHWKNIAFYADGTVKTDILYSLPGYGVWGYENVMKIIRNLNSSGRTLIEEYYDIDGKPVVNQNGVCKQKYTAFHADGTVKEDILYSLPGYGVWGYENVMQVKRQYNEHGFKTAEFYYDIDGNPTVDSYNISHCEDTAFYEDGTTKERIFYSLPGYGVWGNENVMQVKRQYSEHGFQIAEFYYDIDGNPTVNSNNISHWEDTAFHEDGTTKEDILYSLPGHGVWGYPEVMKVIRRFGADGNISEEFYDWDGNIIPDPES